MFNGGTCYYSYLMHYLISLMILYTIHLTLFLHELGELGDFEWNEDEKIPPKDVSSEEWSEFLNTLKKPILETASERVGPISVTNNGFRSLQIENSNLEEEEDCDIILKNKEIDKISNTIVNIVAKVQFASTSSEACNVFLSLDENRRIEILEMLNLTETFLNDFYDENSKSSTPAAIKKSQSYRHLKFLALAKPFALLVGVKLLGLLKTKFVGKQRHGHEGKHPNTYRSLRQFLPKDALHNFKALPSAVACPPFMEKLGFNQNLVNLQSEMKKVQSVADQKMKECSTSEFYDKNQKTFENISKINKILENINKLDNI